MAGRSSTSSSKKLIGDSRRSSSAGGTGQRGSAWGEKNIRQKSAAAPDKKTSSTNLKTSSNPGNDAASPPGLPTRLLGPSQSPRDPNVYSVIRLANGIRAAVNRTCKFTRDEIARCEEKVAAKPKDGSGRVKTEGSRSKCKRTESHYETPSSKRSRATKNGQTFKDVNCVELKVIEFNKQVLHVCENDEDGCNSASTGFSFTCCGLLGDSDGNNSVEGNKPPLPSPEELVKNPQPAAVVEEEVPKPKSMDDEDDEVELPNKKPALNPWNRLDPGESSESNPATDCRKQKYNLSSIAVTLPWGPIFETDDVPGISALGIHCLQSCSAALPIREEETITFLAYAPVGQLRETVKCMADKFPARMDKEKMDVVISKMTKGVSLTERLRDRCWNYGGLGILRSHKRIKLLSTLTKSGHPIRRCALGGKVNKLLSDIPRTDIDRALSEFLKSNIKEKYMTVALSGPEPIEKLEKLVQDYFGNIGTNEIEGNGKSEDSNELKLRKLDGDPDPFETPDFVKFYKILMCPETCGSKCKEHYLTLSFPLPPEAWRNYRTKPVEYISHLVGHKGFGGLHYYLKKRNWILGLEAGCAKTPFHRSHFASLFEISLRLTETGFREYEEILVSTFAYLRMLFRNGPQRHVFKDLQRIQALQFHSIGTGLEDIRVSNDAESLSKSLQIALSDEIVLAKEMFIEYDGPLIRGYLDRFIPENANIMLISNKFPLAITSIMEEEPFLKSKFLAEDIDKNLLERLHKESINPEFRVPARNTFIPESFCILKEDHETGPVITNPKARPQHLSNGDYHDLYFLRDSRYKSQTGCLIHFVPPGSLKSIRENARLTLFHVIFKQMAYAALYPAFLAYTKFHLQRTDYGILAALETNADKLAPIVQTLTNLLQSFEEQLTEEFFELQKGLFLQKICCNLKKPFKLAKDIERVTSLTIAWPSNEYINVIQKITRESIVDFLHNVRRDLYFMLLVIGNARECDAIELANCFENALAPRRLNRRIMKEIRVMQWPLGKTFIKVRGLDKFNPKDFMACHFQTGLASSQNIVMSKLIQPLLQNYFLSEIPDNNIQVIVTTTQKHNVIGICLQVYDTKKDFSRKPQSPEDLEEQISRYLEDFYKKELSELKPQELGKIKEEYLCSCKEPCDSFSNINQFEQALLNLNMDYVSNEAQKCVCEKIKVKDVQQWFTKYFLPNICDCDNDFRQTTVIVIGQKLPTGDPAKKGSCSSNTCGQLLKGVSTLDLEFENPNAPDCEGGKPKNNGKTYVTDISEFKGQLFIHPTVIV